MKTLKRGLRRILAYSKPLSLLIAGVIVRHSLAKVKNDIGRNHNRHLRVRVLRRGIDRLRDAMSAVHYKQGILLMGAEAYAFSEGIFLNMKGTNRYLKIVGEMEGNEGKKMLLFLKSKGVEVKKMIDLGANFGEISLYFSRHCPEAKILAIEPSSSNFKILKSNCHFQNFPTGNILLVNEAVSDVKGVVEITKGISAENILIHSGIHLKEEDSDKSDVLTEKVAADTLASFMERFDFNELDFLKVDIEGSEPMLYESLKQRISDIRSVLIEIGNKADHRMYIPLIELFWDSGMECYDHANDKRFTTLPQTIKEIQSVPVLDLWFIRKDSVTDGGNR